MRVSDLPEVTPLAAQLSFDSKAHWLSTSSHCFSLPCSLGRTGEKEVMQMRVMVVFYLRQESAVLGGVIGSFLLWTGLQMN